MDIVSNEEPPMTKTAEITLTVTTATMGTRTATFRGRNARKQAEFYRALWIKEGHTVTG